MEFCMTSSLALHNWEQKYCQTLGNKPNHSHHELQGWYFSKEKIFKYLIVCFTQCTLFFQKSFFFYCRFVCRALSVGRCGSYVTKINVVLWPSVRQTFVSFGLFTWSVYIRRYCIPIATLNQNKRTRLLYFGDAQIKRSKEKFYFNQEVPWQEASSKVLEPTVAPPSSHLNRGVPVTNHFVQSSGVPWGRVPGMPTGKCIRLRNWVNQVQPGN